MKNSLLKVMISLLTLIALVAVAQAQTRERFGISAKAGGVNAVTGKVSVKQRDKAARLLSSQDDLESGDIVTTSVGSQVEVLLNPGAYLRLAEQSQFVLEDTSLDNLLVRLTKGSAIIEATGPNNVELRIPVATPQHLLTIVRPGVYRINVSSEKTELFVRKGRVELGTGKDDTVKSGKKVTFGTSGETVAKLTNIDKDEFDDWSKTRGQTLAKANTRLSARTVNGYLSANSLVSDWGYGGFTGFGRRWGLWTWSPFANCFTFLPFYYGWGSPYGGYYGAFAPSFGGGYYNRGPYGNPPVIVNGNPGNNGSGSGYPGGSGVVGGSSSGGSGVSLGNSGGRSISTPPSPPSTPSMAGPRDPDSGSRQINTIKPPIN